MVKILHQVDTDCDMESLSVNGTFVGFGNFHDDHCEDRLDAILKTLKLLEIPFEVKVDKDWKYE